MADYDLTLIGGGIIGTAIARDAAGRGLKVLLVEQNDLASGTSSASTKLIHGGLRYLEQGAFRLVQEGLHERTVILQTAPHLVRPMRFILPHHATLRPAWQLRLGLFIYDFLGGNSLFPGARKLNLMKEPAGRALRPSFHNGFEYSDCFVDDARLVVLNAVDAAERGATVRTRTYFERAERQEGAWRVSLNSQGKLETITTQALVNAAGPWVEQANNMMPDDTPRFKVRLIKGSHIVVPRLFEHDNAYIFQNADGRIVFALPFERDFTLIGTTEVDYKGDPGQASASAEEIHYLCTIASDYFRTSISRADVVWSFSGIRALSDSRNIKAKDLSRDFLLDIDTEDGAAALVSIYGGKLTAARHLAEKLLEKLQPFLPMGKAWTAASPLPGGDFEWNEINTLIERARSQWPFLTEAHATRLIRAYGTRVDRVIGPARRMDEMGICFGGDLTKNEVLYLMQNEWARTAEDILWRRTKAGLRLNKQEQHNLAHFMEHG
jgi:glycerol-3-phosphate dehydrogenase